MHSLVGWTIHLECVSAALILPDVFVYCVYLFFRMSSLARGQPRKKKRDRGSGAALRSQERALLGKKGRKEEVMLWRMRIVFIMTWSAE
jgi:hypothetical protein